MAVPSADPTATFHAPGGVPTASVAPGDRARSRFDEELRRLLRSRLILVHLLALAYVLLLAALSSMGRGDEDPALRPDQGNPWRLVPTLAQCLVGAVVLWRSPGMSLRSLRLWELVHFATHAAYFGALRFDMLSAAADRGPVPPLLSVAFAGAVTAHSSAMVILIYGVLIPNTRRRSLAVVAALTAVPFVAAVVAAVANPGLRPQLPPILIQ